MQSERGARRSLLAQKLIERLPGRLESGKASSALTLSDLREFAPDVFQTEALPAVSNSPAAVVRPGSVDRYLARARSKLIANADKFRVLADRLFGVESRIGDLQLLREALCLRAFVDALLAHSGDGQPSIVIAFEGGSGAASSFEMTQGERVLSIISAMDGERPQPSAPVQLQIIVGRPGVDIETFDAGPDAPPTLTCSLIGEGWGGDESDNSQLVIRAEGANSSLQLSAIKTRLEHPELLLLV